MFTYIQDLFIYSIFFLVIKTIRIDLCWTKIVKSSSLRWGLSFQSQSQDALCQLYLGANTWLPPTNTNRWGLMCAAFSCSWVATGRKECSASDTVKKRGGTQPCIRLTVLQELHKNLSLTKAGCLSAGNKMCCCLVKLKSTQNFLTSGGFTHEICENRCSWTPVSQRSIF